MTSELALIFVAGLLGSSHCIGMCGGFAMMVSMNAAARWRGLGRQCVYSTGRIFTYSVLGAVAGLAGHRITSLNLTDNAVRIGAALCVVAGLLLVVEGLSAAGFSWRRRPNTPKTCSSGCLSTSFFSHFLKANGPHNAFLAGLLTGFLPCGLVYAFLALAAARANPIEGMAVMAAFGLGTVPLMVATGIGSTFLTLSGRRRMLRLAAWCVVATGMLTVARGAGFLSAEQSTERPACPFCITEPASKLDAAQ